MTPYDAHLISRLLRGMEDSRLAAAKPDDFRIWPARVALETPIIEDLIASERSRRRSMAA